jgi:DNA-binding LacI/PurR family transcriptional regulator
VLAAIEILQYRPNPMARGLSRGRCQTVGVVVPFFTHASAVERLRGVVSELAGSRYDLVLFNVETAVHRQEHFSALTGRVRADGLLVMSLPPPPDELARLTASGVPVVLVDATGTGVTTVVTDDVAGGRLATQHLVDLGHRRIAFIGGPIDSDLGFTSAMQREHGFREVVAEAGLKLPTAWVRHVPHDRDDARSIALELLGQRSAPTAIFASSDVQATGVLAAARVRRLDVPRDLSVVGFDDVELAAYVGLTTVRQPLFESGRLGAELLLAALAADEPASPTEHLLPLELIERTTTAPPRANTREEDADVGAAR